MLATAPAPQNSGATRGAVQGILRRDMGSNSGGIDETTLAARTKKPSERGSKWKTHTVTPSRSAKVTWDKEESSEEPEPWGRRPDHAPGGLGLLTAALQ